MLRSRLSVPGRAAARHTVSNSTPSVSGATGTPAGSGAGARAIATALSRDRRVGAVHDPGAGSTLTVEFRNAEAAAGFANAARLIAHSAGPRGSSPQVRAAEFLPDRALVRVSVGSEDGEHLQAELLAALDRSTALRHASALRG